MGLFTDELGCWGFYFTSNSLAETRMGAGLTFSFSPQAVQRVAQFAASGHDKYTTSAVRDAGGEITYPISSLPRGCLESFASLLAYSSSIAALRDGDPQADAEAENMIQLEYVDPTSVARQFAYRSRQKALNSSTVRAAPRIRAKSTSTPPSPGPQKELQKSVERAVLSGSSRMNLAREVADPCRRAVMTAQNQQVGLRL
jgi:hypothetical protein